MEAVKASSGLNATATAVEAEQQGEPDKADENRNIKPQPGDTTLGVETLYSVELARGGFLVAAAGSAVDFKGDAVVNAANEGCLGGGGVDGAISRAGGPTLQKARKDLPVLDKRTNSRCFTGSAVSTIGGNLSASWVIHAVGPDYHRFHSYDEADAKLASAYAASMNQAQSLKAETVGFSLISAGVYRANRPLIDVLRLGVESIRNSSYAGLKAVYMIAFSLQEQNALVDILKLIESEQS